MPVLWIMIFLLIASSRAKEVNKPRPHRVTPCGCRYKDVLYDISQLARSDGNASFTIASAVKDNFYSYNPCIPFSIRSKVLLKYHCINVAMCYWSKDGQRRDPLAYQHPGEIHCELSDKDNISLVYLQGGQGRLLNYTTTIEMICDRSKRYPREATMKLKSKHGSALPVFQVFHQCCCPEGCTKCPNPEPSDMLYYEIGAAAGGVVLIVTAGLVGFFIAKKRYRGNNQLLPPGRNNRYGAADQQERRIGQGAEGGDGGGDAADGDGGGGGGGGGGARGGGRRRDGSGGVPIGREEDSYSVLVHGSHTDSESYFSDDLDNSSPQNNLLPGDNHSNSAPSEHDERDQEPSTLVRDNITI